MLALAFTMALVGMIVYGFASALQAYAAARASGPAVLRHPAYLGGMACDGLGWLASLVALAALPIFVVQSILAGSLAITILLAAWWLKVRVTRRDWIGIAVVMAGLVLVSLSAGAESSAPANRTLEWWLLGAAVLVALAAAALYRRGTMLPQSVVAGLGFGGVALCARAAEGSVASFTDAFRSPAAWATLLCSAVGMVLFARALEHGAVGTATATLWVMEVVVPGALGVLLLGDTVRHGWAPAALAGVALAVAGCVVLATSPANEAVGAH